MPKSSQKILERIYDKPIRRCMLKAVEFIEQRKFEQAAQKIYEALAAFKFILFEFFSDFRVTGVEFKKMGLKIDFPNLLADLAFKIVFGGDEQALRLLMGIGSDLKVTADGRVHTASKYSFPKPKTDKEAWSHYNNILRIILAYQDRIPRSKWRE